MASSECIIINKMGVAATMEATPCRAARRDTFVTFSDSLTCLVFSLRKEPPRWWIARTRRGSRRKIKRPQKPGRGTWQIRDCCGRRRSNCAVGTS